MTEPGPTRSETADRHASWLELFFAPWLPAAVGQLWLLRATRPIPSGA